MTGPRPPHYVDLTDLERLRRGWARVWRSDGAFGGDGQSLTEFRQDLPAELARLQDELVDRRYRPRSLRACRIPKADGTCRKLLIPSVRDRVVQQAALSILGPWLDLQFETSSWAYRPGRSHLLALVKLREAWRAGYRWLAEGDIDHFFDRIDRSRLAGLLDLCLPDPELVEPLLAWMGGRAGYGIPQGAPVSPLLSNLYLDRFDEEVGLGGRRLVRFADDFVIATRSPMEAADALVAARRVLGAVGLRLNTEKTAIRAPSDSIAFLGSEMTGGALRTVARAPRPHVGRARRARGDGWSFWFPKRQRDAFRAGLTVPEADRRPTTRNGASRWTGGDDGLLVPVSALRDLVHCPHAAYRRLHLGENPETPAMRRGAAEHRAALDGIGGTEVLVRSAQLGIVGRVDKLEQRGKQTVVIELRSGRARRPTSADAVQVCAYALALGHGVGGTSLTAELAFTDNRRREPIPLSEALVSSTRLLIRQLREIRDGHWAPSNRRRQACTTCRFRPACRGE